MSPGPEPPTPPYTDGVYYRLVEIDGVYMNVICDGAGNLGILVVGGNNFLLRRDSDNVYLQEFLAEGQWSGGTTIMATFDNGPEQFEWHDHEFDWNGTEYGVNPQPEEWTE